MGKLSPAEMDTMTDQQVCRHMIQVHPDIVETHLLYHATTLPRCADCFRLHSKDMEERDAGPVQ